MLYNYSDMTKLFETISKVVKKPGDFEYSEELRCYVSYNRATKIIDHFVNGGVTADDYIFVHKGIEHMRPKCYINRYSAFDGFDPIELKNTYHNMVSLFGGDEAAKLIDGKNIFGKAYCNAMKRCNRSSTKLYSIPDAKTVFEEFSKLLKRKVYDGAIIDDDKMLQYMK